MNSEIKDYINNNIIPLYKNNDDSHSISHINNVINYSLEYGKKYNLDENILYTISAYHDIGTSINRENHEKISAEYFLNDKFLEEKFAENDRKIIYEAIIDHRASKKKEPRSIYGKLVATADRQFDCFEEAIKRTYIYLTNIYSKNDKDNIYELIYNDFNNRYGPNGYVKVYVNEKEFEEKLQPIKELLLNKNKFINKIRKVVEGKV